MHTGEFMDDFSASSADRGNLQLLVMILTAYFMSFVALVTCREILGLPANELVEVFPAKYPRYEVQVFKIMHYCTDLHLIALL